MSTYTEAHRKYRRGEKGKRSRREYNKRWAKTEAGRAARRRYDALETTKARKRAYRASERGREKVRESARNRARRIRGEVLLRYGGDPPACACCGEGRLEFLAINHINGAGEEHRRSIRLVGGSGFYSWLRKNGYPEGYNVLCHNCNQSLGAYGYCPHDRPW